MCHQSFESTKIAENLKNYHLLRNNYLTNLFIFAGYKTKNKNYK